MDVHDGTDVSRQQIVFAVAGDSGGEDDLLEFQRHFFRLLLENAVLSLGKPLSESTLLHRLTA